MGVWRRRPGPDPTVFTVIAGWLANPGWGGGVGALLWEARVKAGIYIHCRGMFCLFFCVFAF